jgi:uncharacterized Zn-binding protein involved in type VI secretion
MPLVIRLGDTSTHGGVVITACTKWQPEGKLAARKGDILACPKHGPNPIIEGSPNVFCEGKEVARHGDHTACGARLISGAMRTFVNGG